MKNFTRTIEDFNCEVCGIPVKGNGYTNHCPHCLSSKHVDINPGDRVATCQGIMLADHLEFKNGDQYIVHKCTKCTHIRKNKAAPEDNFRAILALSNGTIKDFLMRFKKP